MVFRIRIPFGRFEKSDIEQIGMSTLFKSTKTKGPIHQKVGNTLEIMKSLKKSEIRPREGGKLNARTPVTHGQYSCMQMIYGLVKFNPLWGGVRIILLHLLYIAYSTVQSFWLYHTVFVNVAHILNAELLIILRIWNLVELGRNSLVFTHKKNTWN